MLMWLGFLLFHQDLYESNLKMENTGFMDVVNSRAQRMDMICKDKFYDGKGNTLRVSHLYWLQNLNIAYCPIFKSATSTWRNHLINLLNLTHGPIEKNQKNDKGEKRRVQMHDTLLYLGAVNPKSRDWINYIKELPAQNNFTGFMVVRHPFERLVSAYRDKLERNNLKEPFYYEKFGKHFVEKYREMAIEALGEEYFSKENNFGTPIKVFDNRRPNADLPSFWEFAQSVIDKYKIDEHWVPINEYCSICSPTTLKAFHYILKFEELSTEEAYFLEHCHWNISEDKVVKLNVNHPDDMPGDKLSQMYFSVLSKTQITQLYEIYELDFLLFNYTFQINDLILPPRK